MPIYNIKPLDWQLIRDNEEGVRWTADTIFGSIDVDREPWQGCRWHYCFDEYYDEGRHACESVEVGKQEAEQFYLGRLLPALELIPEE